MLLPDGFPGQRLRVLPRPLVAAALRRPPTAALLVTDAGYFPHAANHGRRRPEGTPEVVVIVCVDGIGHCEAGGRSSVVHPHHALVLPPDQPHVYWADPKRPWTIWWLHAAGTQVAQLLSVIAPDGREQVVELHDVYRAVSTIDDTIGFLERDETVPSLISASGSGWALLAQVAADTVGGGLRRTEPVRQAHDYLRRNFAKPVSVSELARTAGLSTSHFAALFRAATGSGVVEYTKRLRMARARELLITSSRDIADVAVAVGYPDPFYFSRQFRTVHGCSPSEYRSTHRG
ncbi:AraC family transcriptional regulator [Pseudonocardia sp. TRM90224]|uniref:AraC family transcriptional regulator n=1 Tax=Pseudonocardia sp. TRM90224 TaxID=2812678 RepID=UPI001E357310|nr:AraC family transcriptional regulator [Pseudonocardia sp. TRM90224]